MKAPSVENVNQLREQIAVLEGVIREKKEQLRIAEAIEKQKDDLWRKHMAELNDPSPPKSTIEDDEV